VHLKDVDPDGRWVPLGAGRVPWDAVVGRLQEAGYAGAWSLETHCEVDGSVEKASRVAIEHLRKVTA
jgi:sugar phosphate isomerase/epimerase